MSPGPGGETLEARRARLAERRRQRRVELEHEYEGPDADLEKLWEEIPLDCNSNKVSSLYEKKGE